MEAIIWYVAGAVVTAAEAGYLAYVFYAAVYLYANNQSNLMRHRARRAAAARGTDGRKEMIRQPITNRRTIYGTGQYGGPITLLHVSPSKDLYILVTLSGHAVKSIDDVYFNDDKLEVNSDGTVFGKYHLSAVIKKGLGTTEGDADLNAFLIAEGLVNESGNPLWTANHLQTGCAKILAKLSPNRDVYSHGIPNISCVVRGKELYDPRTATTYYTANPALCIRDYLLDTSMGLGAVSAEVDNNAIVAAANLCEEAVTLTSSTHTFTAKRLFTPTRAPSQNFQDSSAGTLLGTYLYQITFYAASGETDGSPGINVWAGFGADEVGSVSLVDIQTGPTGTTGRKIYRDGYLVGTISDNTTTTFLDTGFSPGAAIPVTNTSEITDTILRSTAKPHLLDGDPVTLTTTGTLPSPLATGTTYYYIYVDNVSGKLATTKANALSGTAITRTNTGSGVHSIDRSSEVRYALHGPVESSDVPKIIIEGMLTSCAGKLMNPGGIWTLYAGSYRTPTITLDENDLDGPIRVVTRLSKRELCNGVKGVFVDPVNDWQPTDFPAVTNSTYTTEDNEERLWRDVELPFTISSSMAQRLSKIELERTRQQISTSWPCKLTALRAQVGDVVNLTNTRFGWSSKPFEIGDFRFVVRNENDAPRLGLDITLRETASGVYDWNSGEETQVDLAPDTSLPDPFDIEVIAGLSVASGTSHLLLMKDGTVTSRAFVSWTSVTDEYVRSGGFVEVQYRKTTSRTLDWEKAANVPGTESGTYILDVEDGKTYLFRARAVNNLGVRSGWGSPISHTIVGKTEPPPDVDSFEVVRLGDGTRKYAWTYLNPPLDLGGFIIRYKSGTGHVWADLSPLHTGLLIASPFESNALAAGTYTLGIKAVDTSGNESLNAEIITQTLADPRLGGSLLEVNPIQEGWPGTKTHCWVDEENNLVISDSMTWATMSSSGVNTWADWTSWAMAPYASATYVHPEIDLGAAYTFTFLVSVVGTVNTTVEESHSEDGVIYTAYAATGVLITARYVRLRITLEIP